MVATTSFMKTIFKISGWWILPSSMNTRLEIVLEFACPFVNQKTQFKAIQLLSISESLCSPLFMNKARNVKGTDTIRLIMITVSRVFSSKCIPQKGRSGIGNKKTSHSPTSMITVFHRFLSFSRNIYPALIT